MSDLLAEIHPGEILLEDFMKPMGISGRQLAADIDVPPSRISELVNGIRPITPDTALRLDAHDRASITRGHGGAYSGVQTSHGLSLSPRHPATPPRTARWHSEE